VASHDADDDHVIAAAVAARAELIVTGDRRHLVPIGSHQGIAIVMARGGRKDRSDTQPLTVGDGREIGEPVAWPTRKPNPPTLVSVESFLAQVPGPVRQADCRKLAAMMERATGAPACMWGPSIVGFSRYRYKYDSGREGESMLVGFSPRKSDLTLYIVPGFKRYAELMARLSKVKTGKACLYIKKLADVDEAVLQELIDASVAEMAPRRVDR
jgi:Domain of unknown function (DU1801)